MGFNPLKLLGAAAKTIGRVFGVDLGAIEEALSSGNLTPEQRAALMEHEVELKRLAMEEMRTEIEAKVDLMKAEIASEDPYVKRARPTGLYVFYGVTIVQVAVVSAVILFGIKVDYLALSAAFGSITGPLAGYSGWYAWNRSKDKENGVAS